jgi:hypothetical protein
MSDDDPRGIDEIVRRLAESVGTEKARQVADAVLARLERPNPERLLDALSSEPGLVGAAARVVRMRRRTSSPLRVDDTKDVGPPSSAPSYPESTRPREATIDPEQLVMLFAESLGNDKSRETIFAALKRDNLPNTALDQRTALELLERLAHEPGIVGVTARFAKARLILLFPRR